MDKPTLVLLDGTVIETPEYVCKDSMNSSYVSYRWITCDGVQVIQDREYGCKNLGMNELKRRKEDLEDALEWHKSKIDQQHRAELLLIRYDQCLEHMAMRLIGVQQEGTLSENLKHTFTG